MDALKTTLSAWVKFLLSFFLLIGYPIGLLVGLYYSLGIWNNSVMVTIIYFLVVSIILGVAYEIKFRFTIRNIHKVSSFGDR